MQRRIKLKIALYEIRIPAYNKEHFRRKTRQVAETMIKAEK